ncbi:MAG: FtsX-like permease family protein [Bacteroidales bacterium]|jgi:lipoprotein-releasing system permease protein|nr:FtsX-like permease family protein [Bacteroidales bacterium]
MNTPFFIARKYFFAKKSKLVNQISWVSSISIAIGTAALVIVLSIFNGIFNLVSDMYGGIDPDLKIVPASGKSFFVDEINTAQILKIEGVENVIPVLEDEVLADYSDKQRIVTIKGVDEQYAKLLSDNIIEGDFRLKTDSLFNFCILGYAVAFDLGVNFNAIQALTFYAPTRSKTMNAANNAYKQGNCFPAGSFESILEYDNKYVIVPLDFAQNILSAKDEISAYEILLSNNANIHRVQKDIQQKTGDNYQVINQLEMHNSFYKVVKSEKFITIIILSFILLLSTFNMMVTLMLVIRDKKNDISTLQTMGMKRFSLRKIFLYEGLMIALIGGMIGIVLGTFLIWLQEYFGFIKFGDGENFVVPAYPVDLQLNDIVLVAMIAFGIAFFSSIIASRSIGKNTNLRIATKN